MKSRPSKNTSWNNVAGWYDELLEHSKDTYQEKVILPNLLRIVDPKKDTVILDNACGQGYFSRAFFEKGSRVIGRDLSPSLIEIARKRSAKEIDFKVSAAHDLADMASESIDVITIILALQNIKDINEVFTESARVLKKSGRLVMVINHPSFRQPSRSSWQWDTKTNQQYRRIDAYMSEYESSIDMTPGEKRPDRKTSTTSFHRPLQVYIKALNKAGFLVSRLEEWISHKTSEQGPRATEEDRLRKEIPLFLCIESRK